MTLQAARHYAGDLTAIVSVADDGGSSGKLRQALGIPAPGDLRRCLVALSDPSTNALAAAFEHRFDDGHALGNLLIAGLTASTGSFTDALHEAARLLDAQGTVLPATVDPVVLKAVADCGEVEGQVNVASAGRITHVSVVPPDAPPPAEALEAIARADQLLLGPGSLFTSVLAVVAVPAAPPGARRRRRAGRSTSATSGTAPRRGASTSPPTSTRSSPTAWSPTSSSTTRRTWTRAGATRGASRPTSPGPTDTAHDPVKLARALEDLMG